MVGQMTEKGFCRQKWIDAAKGIAILMVIAVHLSQCLPNLWRPVKLAASFGAMGVQLFLFLGHCCGWGDIRMRYSFFTLPLYGFF